MKVKKTLPPDIPIDLSETKICTSQAHFSNFQFPKDKVPIKEFIKELKDGKIQVCNTCSECRNKRTLAREKLKDGRRDENVDKGTDSSFRLCISECHSAKRVSKYLRDKVPIELFLGRTKGKIYENCLDCRNHISQITVNTKYNKKLKAQPGEYICPHCSKTGVGIRAVNLDGTLSSRCIYCKEAEIKFNASYQEKKRQILIQTKLEKIKNNECCCEKCKSIFLRSSDNKPFIELKTYIENNIRYVKYLSENYTAKEFFDKFENLLELKMVEFDHLSEKEQRERNIIQPHEPFIEKKHSVSEMRTEWDIRNEAKITQILCCLCHLKATIARENEKYIETKYNRKNIGKTRDKYKYINDLKMEKGGCEICGFFDPELLRYLEFDHININEKTETICNMINREYTLDDIIKECKKCRLLCKICHRIHTQNQIEEGLFDSAYRKYPLFDKNIPEYKLSSVLNKLNC